MAHETPTAAAHAYSAAPLTYLGRPAREETQGWNPLDCRWEEPSSISTHHRRVLRAEVRPGLWVTVKVLEGPSNAPGLPSVERWGGTGR